MIPSAAAGAPRLDIDAQLAEYTQVQRALSDPAVHADQAAARRLGRRYAELTPIVSAAAQLATARGDLEAARELGAEDQGFAQEAVVIQARVQELESRLAELLAPRDPDDARDVLVEVKAGEGGEESALFAGDLLRMYLRYAERRGWKTEVLSATESDLGGYKDATIAIKAPGAPAPGDGVWARMKFEGGVHRVQRVPVTESQGRVHTSAAGVFVAPEPEDTVDVPIPDGDLRVDVFRSSGPGGQSVNTTDSAVRITHLPTGIVVSCQNEKSQLQNKEQAMRILRARLLAAARATADAAAADARRSQVRTVDRSERVRTYNFPENRIADHRVGFKAYNLDAVLDGDLDAVLDALENADRAERIGSSGTLAGTRGGAVTSGRA
ncbi:MAG TPA: peptide chain release factor 1 [Nakamurella sp.]|nr:peptide chain release factor 1 [Nakamurella sp.]